MTLAWGRPSWQADHQLIPGFLFLSLLYYSLSLYYFWTLSLRVMLFLKAIENLQPKRSTQCLSYTKERCWPSSHKLRFLSSSSGRGTWHWVKKRGWKPLLLRGAPYHVMISSEYTRLQTKGFCCENVTWENTVKLDESLRSKFPF